MGGLRFIAVTSFVMLTRSVLADWSLYGNLDRALVYEGQYYREYEYSDKDIRGPGAGRLMRSVFPTKDGGLRPYAPGMEVGGEVRRGQLLLSGESVFTPTIVEFVVIGGTRITFEYGLCDRARKLGNLGTKLRGEVRAGSVTQTHMILIGENHWVRKTITLPQADRVLVRLVAKRRNRMSTNWTGLIVTGDGVLGTRAQARALSPNRQRIGKTDLTLHPSPYRVTARKGYDILFYRGKPFLSFAAKGHPRGSHEYQAKVGFNTYYVEGMTFGRYWPKGAEGVAIPKDSLIYRDLWLCQKFNMPYKCPMSLAHCSPFLPPWLVAKEHLGLVGHKLRRGGPSHTSFIKPATMRFHKQGLRGWVKPFLNQPAIFVFSQEDDASLWDDHSQEAVASWRRWLRKRFAADFKAFRDYAGGVKEIEGFDSVPQPRRFEPDGHFGYPMRLAYLKLLWITDSYAEYLSEMFAFVRKLAPGVPLTQRYVNWANGLYVSRRVESDYNYTFAHLTVEGVPNSYGIGKKYWTGIYAHMGTLPLPRGGSIGKTYSREIRRGKMDEREWRINAYTSMANGACGFEYSPFVPTWGPRWVPAALFDNDFRLTPTGRAGQRVIKEALACSKYMMHYEHYSDVAVFHDASFNTGPFAGRWSQSKVGLYTLIRETGFHADPLTEWDMVAENLKGRRVLVLGGTLSIAPEIQEAIRTYVRNGGTLIALFCSDGQGFPGANSYAYACKPRESAAVRSFDSPRAVAHLGDVLGIRKGGGVTARREVRSDRYGTISLRPFNVLAEEGRWVAQQACCAQLEPTNSARGLATFEDGSPAVMEHRFGRGVAITFAFDLGLIANNVTIPTLYRWWSGLLSSLGCRKAIDSGNWYVEAGAWHDDSGHRLVILVNHDDARAQTAKLPDGRRIQLAPRTGKTFVLSR